MTRLVGLSESDKALMALSMRIASEQFEKDSKTEGLPVRTREAFVKQAADARALAERIEAADDVAILPGA